MTIEKFDREKAQAHLDSHEDAVVLYSNDRGHWSANLNGDKFQFEWVSMRLCHLADTPQQSAAEQPKEKSFHITGPGRYRQRDGRIAEVFEEIKGSTYSWMGECADNVGVAWLADGSVEEHFFNSTDLIARLPDEPEQPTIDQGTGQVKLPKGPFEVTAPLRPFGASGTDPIIQDILHRLTALEQSKNGEKS